jgi:hypothetical protein
VPNKFRVRIKDWYWRDVPDDLGIVVDFKLQIDGTTSVASK